MGKIDEVREIVADLREKINEVSLGGTVDITVPPSHAEKLCSFVELLLKLVDEGKTESSIHADSAHVIDDDAVDTYDGWKNRGRGVIKGEKATGRNADGIATFKASQTQARDGSLYSSPSPRPRYSMTQRPWQDEDHDSHNPRGITDEEPPF